MFYGLQKKVGWINKMADHHWDNEIQKVDILNCILNMIGSQCYNFNRGIERLKREAFVPTLAKLF